jgi:hypothetical protein
MVLIPLSIQNVYSPAGTVPLPFYLTSCAPTKSNLYLNSSVQTAIGEPTLYKFLMLHVPNLMSIFLRLGHLSKESIKLKLSPEQTVEEIHMCVSCEVRTSSTYKTRLSPQQAVETYRVVRC